MNESMMERRAPAPVRPLLVAAAGVALLAVTVWSGLFRGGAEAWPDYAHLLANVGTWAGRWRWVLGDASEVTFYKHEFASLGLLAGAALAHWANRNGKRWQGFAICYGSRQWPWVAGASMGGLLLANMVFGFVLDTGQWQPTFVAAVSVPAAVVLLFGGRWETAIAGAVAGALLVTPMAVLLLHGVCVPLGLPGVVANVLAMALASGVVFQLVRLRGWRPATAPATADCSAAAAPARHGLVWGLRRTLADFSEAPFFGNELASAGLIGGVLLAAWLQPAGPFYGTGWLLPLLLGQALASAVGVWVWRDRWIQRGWYPTYIPIVSVVPACILTHGPGMGVVVLSALLAALITPPLAAGISDRLPAHLHPYIGNLLSMAIGVLGIVPLVGWLLRSGA